MLKLGWWGGQITTRALSMFKRPNKSHCADAVSLAFGGISWSSRHFYLIGMLLRAVVPRSCLFLCPYHLGRLVDVGKLGMATFSTTSYQACGKNEPSLREKGAGNFSPAEMSQHHVTHVQISRLPIPSKQHWVCTQERGLDIDRALITVKDITERGGPMWTNERDENFLAFKQTTRSDIEGRKEVDRNKDWNGRRREGRLRRLHQQDCYK